ncbi:hypothetical protein ACERII_24390 [Evansella sp. AB-rgal1]|uniref:hypothetical protein n=1 Tax=Evansella sp. AB-rgal1 TaxID=3242696 RepID=UPI00359DEDC1
MLVSTIPFKQIVKGVFNLNNYISNAIVASFIVVLITSVLSYWYRGYIHWVDLVNSAIGTFIIWAFLFPLVYKLTGHRESE